jgi:hypothetical protein
MQTQSEESDRQSARRGSPSSHPYRTPVAREAHVALLDDEPLDWSLLITGSFLCLWSAARIVWAWAAMCAFDAEEAFAVIVLAASGSALLRWAHLRWRGRRLALGRLGNE